jgi:primosomal protein N' (replication factor Y)
VLFANVVLGLPVEGPFDYIVPENLEKTISPGKRVWVSFGTRKMLGYVVSLSRKSLIKNPKKILDVLDSYPILDKNMLSLTKEISLRYCCSWGEAIETALPQDLRKRKKIQDIDNSVKIAFAGHAKPKDNRELLLIHDLDRSSRWDIYLEKIKEASNNNESVIVLLPDYNSVLKVREIISQSLGVEPVVLHRKQKNETLEWLKIKQARANIVLATRSGIFAPFTNLGLVIIDEEHDKAFKQDQVPHYHARDIAIMRVNLEKSNLILGSASPSLESFYLAQKNKIKYKLIPRSLNFPEIKIIDIKSLSFIDRKKNIIFSKYLTDSIYSVLNSKGKTLLFLNRKGFATFAYCHNCGRLQKCPRCNVNLVYHFGNDMLSCHYCNFKLPPPKICPYCNAGYIKYSGLGTEKIESELSRAFPNAVIKRIDNQENLNLKQADIFVSTSSIIKQRGYNFDLIGVLAIDNSLNRVDFRSQEKTFAILMGLLGLTDKKLVIQSSLPRHNCLQALTKNDINVFYEEELRQRKQLNFPPYKHMVLVKLRGQKEEKIKVKSQELFNRLNQYNKYKYIRIVSVNPGQPTKLRGNFYWQLLIITDNPKKVSTFLKMCLKDFSHSGIIVTVDVDPV